MGRARLGHDVRLRGDRGGRGDDAGDEPAQLAPRRHGRGVRPPQRRCRRAGGLSAGRRDPREVADGQVSARARSMPAARRLLPPPWATAHPANAERALRRWANAASITAKTAPRSPGGGSRRRRRADRSRRPAPARRPSAARDPPVAPPRTTRASRRHPVRPAPRRRGHARRPRPALSPVMADPRQLASRQHDRDADVVGFATSADGGDARSDAPRAARRPEHGQSSGQRRARSATVSASRAASTGRSDGGTAATRAAPGSASPGRARHQHHASADSSGGAHDPAHVLGRARSSAPAVCRAQAQLRGQRPH